MALVIGPAMAGTTVAFKTPAVEPTPLESCNAKVLQLQNLNVQLGDKAKSLEAMVASTPKPKPIPRKKHRPNRRRHR